MLPMSLESRSPLEGFITRAGVGRHWKTDGHGFCGNLKIIDPYDWRIIPVTVVSKWVVTCSNPYLQSINGHLEEQQPDP